MFEYVCRIFPQFCGATFHVFIFRSFYLFFFTSFVISVLIDNILFNSYLAWFLFLFHCIVLPISHT